MKTDLSVKIPLVWKPLEGSYYQQEIHRFYTARITRFQKEGWWSKWMWNLRFKLFRNRSGFLPNIFE